MLLLDLLELTNIFVSMDNNLLILTAWNFAMKNGMESVVIGNDIDDGVDISICRGCYLLMLHFPMSICWNLGWCHDSG